MKKANNLINLQQYLDSIRELKIVIFLLLLLTIPLFSINIELSTDSIENSISKIDSPITIKFPREIYETYEDIYIYINNTLIYASNSGQNGFFGEMYVEDQSLFITLLSNSPLPPMSDYNVSVSFIDPKIGSTIYTNFYFSTMFIADEEAKIANTLITSENKRVVIGLVSTKSGPITLNIFSIDGILIQSFQQESCIGEDLFFEWDTKDKWGNYVANSYYILKIIKPDGNEILPLIIRR